MKKTVNSVKIKAYLFTASILLFLNDFAIAQRYMRGNRGSSDSSDIYGFLAFLILVAFVIAALFIFNSTKSVVVPNSEKEGNSSGCIYFVVILVVLYVTAVLIANN